MGFPWDSAGDAGRADPVTILPHAAESPHEHRRVHQRLSGFYRAAQQLEVPSRRDAELGIARLELEAAALPVLAPPLLEVQEFSDGVHVDSLLSGTDIVATLPRMDELPGPLVCPVCGTALGDPLWCRACRLAVVPAPA